jgi:NTE family protein
VFLPRHKPDQLCVVAADISTETKVSLPRMAALYWPHPDQVNVADFARASMSIPGFFSTFKVKSLPAEEARTLWRSQGWPERCYEGDFLPAVHHFVDGGVLSNFPIDAFHHRTRVPLRPTLGVKLQWDEHKHDIPGVLKVFSQSFNTARHAMDAEFLKQNPDYSKLVAYIDTEDISWLDFAMSNETKLRLFRMGALTAVAFLRGFNWRDYKRIRRSLAEAHSRRV